MLTLEDPPRRLQDLAIQRELLKTQLATFRALHIALVGPACILVTHLPANLKTPVVFSEELFTVIESQLLRALSAMEKELKQIDIPRTEQVRAAA